MVQVGNYTRKIPCWSLALDVMCLLLGVPWLESIDITLIRWVDGPRARASKPVPGVVVVKWSELKSHFK